MNGADTEQQNVSRPTARGVGTPHPSSAATREQVQTSGIPGNNSAGVTVEMLLPYAYDDVSQVLHEMAALSVQAHLDKLVEDAELRCVAGCYFPVPAA
jgi:hypothetical protein